MDNPLEPRADDSVLEPRVLHRPAQESVRPTPLDSDEEARFYATMAQWLAQELAQKGFVRLAAADTPERQRQFQEVAHRASELIRRPITTTSSSHGMTFELAGHEPLPGAR
ncbi:hypothetical protein ACFMQL_12080 [Nonomuraea fastidiosa]|jgi:hypothetical protein|uniref:hypothetical protein n=1 Tax=Nonomuraea fastidiosa TaxID=46173 RepID=UPI00366F4597